MAHRSNVTMFQARTDRDPSVTLQGANPLTPKKSFPAISPKAHAEVLPMQSHRPPCPLVTVFSIRNGRDPSIFGG